MNYLKRANDYVEIEIEPREIIPNLSGYFTGMIGG
jgi:hypothetical protein